MVTLDKQGNPLPGVNVETVVVPSVFRVRKFPAPADNDTNPFFVFEAFKLQGVPLDRLAGVRCTEKEAISYATNRTKFASSKFVILTAPDLIAAQDLFDRAKGIAF